MGDAELLGYSRAQLLQMNYVFGELKEELRFCKCGDVSTEWDAHLCPLTIPRESAAESLGKTVRDALGSLHEPTCHCRSCEAHTALSQLIELCST